MNKEIERKFIVTMEDFLNICQKHKYNHLKQGYITIGAGFHTRIRIVDEKTAILCSKVNKVGYREEYEQEIDIEHGQLLYKNAQKVLEKCRVSITVNGLHWDIDNFFNDNKIVAEVEYPTVGQYIHLPEWVGKEVTDDKEYSNIRLARKQ